MWQNSVSEKFLIVGLKTSLFLHISWQRLNSEKLNAQTVHPMYDEINVTARVKVHAPTRGSRE